ncbi:hypothetical protein GTQ99_02230 [Kineococcus sp. T13]|uniref:helix-turn-helix domain-containing protein n=1 Tax=Kineococcus vitellinus TaxID=2696565 RepID=UPI00141374E6|nr:helix-turn-helix transcriptional regulator [Kineococcus vitellinus]NAZ74247.1 hypothetical protein [Kineococcus vitellinus]
MDVAAVTIAAELGALTSKAESIQVAGRVLELLNRVLPSDASALQLVDGARTSILASRGGVGDTWSGTGNDAGSDIARSFLNDPHLPRVVGARVPRSLSTDAGNTFREGSFFRRYLQPSGFQDGMSVHLAIDGVTLGFLHLSAVQEVFGHEQQVLAAAFQPVLAKWLHEERSGAGCRRIGLDLSHRLPAHCCAAVVTGGRVEEVTGFERPHLLADPVFARILHHCGLHPRHRLTAWWYSERGWYRFVVEPLLGGERVLNGAVPLLVHAVAGDLPAGLTHREVDVLTCLAVGMDNASIADLLGISLRTVHSHVEGARRKTGSANRLQAAAYAHREGVLHPLRQLPDAGVGRLWHRQ